MTPDPNQPTRTLTVREIGFAWPNLLAKASVMVVVASDCPDDEANAAARMLLLHVLASEPKGGKGGEAR